MNAYQKSRTWWKKESCDEMHLMSRDSEEMIGRICCQGNWFWQCGDGKVGYEDTKEAAMSSVENSIN